MAGLGTYREKGADEFGTEKDDEEISVTLRFDVLCLALGLLTNLVESVDEVKEILRTTRSSSPFQLRCRRSY